jgi:(p)ppGpp synthase/HD superfamily hydrolase
MSNLVRRPPPAQIDWFGAAVIYAAQAHAHQTRKGTIVPYLSHVLQVGLIALEHGGNDLEVTAAILHDVAEDAGGEARLADVRTQFGPQVADIVTRCSDTLETPKPPWRARKEAHLRHLEEAGPSILLVVACDKLANVQSIIADLRSHGIAVWSRFTTGREGTVWYYREAAALLERRLPGRLTSRLTAAVLELESAKE